MIGSYFLIPEKLSHPIMTVSTDCQTDDVGRPGLEQRFSLQQEKINDLCIVLAYDIELCNSLVLLE